MAGDVFISLLGDQQGQLFSAFSGPRPASFPPTPRHARRQRPAFQASRAIKERINSHLTASDRCTRRPVNAASRAAPAPSLPSVTRHQGSPHRSVTPAAFRSATGSADGLFSITTRTRSVNFCYARSHILCFSHWLTTNAPKQRVC